MKLFSFQRSLPQSFNKRAGLNSTAVFHADGPVLKPNKGFAKLLFFFFMFNFSTLFSFGQNIAINTTGAANSTLSMLEILQISTTASTKGLHVAHSGAITGTGYGIWSEVTGASTTNIAGYFNAAGATNNYAGIFMGGNVGIGTSSPGNKLSVTSATALDGIYQTDGTRWLKYMSGTVGGGSYNNITQANDNAIIFSGGAQGSGNLVIGPWANAGVVAGIRMDGNGNVGIGTASPSNTLEVNGIIKVTNYSGYLTLGKMDNVDEGGEIRLGGANAYSSWVQDVWASTMRFTTTNQTSQVRMFDGGTGSMGLYVQGNVGIGIVTPQNKLDVEGGAVIGATYSGTNAAPADGLLIEGNVGIGTTSPGNKLHVEYSNTGTTIQTSSPPIVVRNNTTTSGALTSIRFVGSTSAGASYPTGYIGTYNTPGAGLASGAIYFAPVTTAGNLSEAMRITANGNVGIGTTNPGVRRLDVVSSSGSGATVNGSNFAMSLQFGGGGAEYGIAFAPKNANPVNMYFCHTDGTTVGSITSTNVATVYNTTSDIRLKKNINTSLQGLNDLMKLNIVEYNFTSDENQKLYHGFIAQELYKILPEAVWVGGDDPRKNPWQVDYSRLTPLLAKAIQEQQKIIEDQKAEIANMKNEFTALKEVVKTLQLQINSAEKK